MHSQRSLPIITAAVLLLLASLACGLFTSATPTAAPPLVVTEQVSPPIVEPPTTSPPVLLETPTEVPPAATPTAESQQFFTEEFDNGVDKWSPFVTHGDLSQLDFSAKDSRLSFDLKEKQLWAYAIYTPQTYTDVRIDAKVDNLGQNENNITLVCRYNKERGWYEFNIANSGLYWIYFGKWDSSGLTASYAVIADGGSNNIRQGLATNTYSMICKGNTITAFVNDKEVKRVDDNQHGLREGQIGIGVSSFRRLPIEVEFDWVKISQP